ncbi:YbjQ family protein [Desulfofalx alkaliphila]|uniref:YbjQ family protein n=1 Tax=Desulfofalx alkaliphila TaxID=105483 RepID=UPI0004E19E53|nr:YbjQ family protein [Desulfofalx alkaliphila]
MLLTTTEINTEYQVLGLVKGSTVKTRHLGKDIMAFIRMLFGGNVKEYSDLLESARREAEEIMIREARAKGANAVIGVRYASSQIAQGASEVIVYGTAVKI